jgi:outer membrane autotransporter protein
MVSNNRHAHDGQHVRPVWNVLSVASFSRSADDRGRAARSSIHARLLSGASSLALSVASMIVALGVCVPGDAQAQTTVNPVQTTAFTLDPAQNPIIFGAGTNIDTTATGFPDAVFGANGTAWTVTNQGTLLGSLRGVFSSGAGSALTNSGSITGAADAGIELFAGGTVVNQVGGTISGRLSGIKVSNGVGDITNAGTITGLLSSASFGIDLVNGGTVTNQVGGTINGGGGGIVISSVAGTVTNAGTITGVAGGSSVIFGGTGTNTLTLQTGSVLTGDAVGSTATGATNNLVLQGVGHADNNFVNFNSLEVQKFAIWQLNGDATVGAVTVQSDATLAINAVLTGTTVTVNPAAAVFGVGTIKGDVVNNGGQLSPGPSGGFGSLTVTGNVGFTSGSTLFINAGPTQASKLTVGGTATLTGATVSVQALGTGFAPSHTYTILTVAGGGLGSTNNNTFSGVTSNSAFLTPTLSYDATDVFLTLACNSGTNCSGGTGGTGGGTAGTGFGFANAAQTRNQQAVAGALDASPASNPLVTAVLNQTADGARQAFDALSGEVFGSVQNTQAGQTQFARSAMLGRMRQASYSGAPGELGALAFGGPELAYASGDANGFPVKAPGMSDRSRDLTFWAQGLGGWGHTDSDGNAASVSSRFGGFLSGVDARYGDTLRAGLVAGYLRSDLNAAARSSSAGIDSVQLGAYAGGRLGAFNVRGGASYSYDSIDTSRAIFFPGFTDQTQAHFHGHVGQVFGEVGYGMTFGSVAVEPLAGLAYVHLHNGAFLESGGVAALSGSSVNENIGYSSLGLRAATALPLANGTVLVPRGSLQWQHAFGDVIPAAALAFQGTGAAFSTAGVPIARDTALIESGFDWRFSPQARLGAYYQGELAAHAQAHAFKGTFNWNF